MSGGTRRIGRIDVIVSRREQALARLVAAVRDHAPCVIGFANAHTIDLARRSPELADAFRDITLFNDGVGVDLWSRLVWGERFPDNLNGTDLTPQLCAALPAGTALYLIGDRAEVVAAAAARVAADHPHLRIAGFRDGFFAVDEEPGVRAAIAASGADLVLAGMGQPKQELWALGAAPELGRPVLCIGAWFGFVSGLTRRAPPLVRAVKMEWLYRLYLEPTRLADRYVRGALRLAAGIREQRAAVRRGEI